MVEAFVFFEEGREARVSGAGVLAGTIFASPTPLEPADAPQRKRREGRGAACADALSGDRVWI